LCRLAGVQAATRGRGKPNSMAESLADRAEIQKARKEVRDLKKKTSAKIVGGEPVKKKS